ncbi:MAG: crossover junction endodeoxyribonuclease RuvC [Pseudomonadales bacterium]|nr:crossover junction endodeoxyribonuclease RuvC [Pseudomonadales bacterium]
MFKRSTPTETFRRVPTNNPIILGIDPGSRRTGYGVVEMVGSQPNYLASGCINVEKLSMPNRLGEIYRSVGEVIATYSPQSLAIEEVFVSKNPKSALLLGQARGVAIAAAVHHNLTVAEYAARQIKLAVVGTGRASKEQVQHMVQVILNLSGQPQADAADALAIALCHVNTASNLIHRNPT